jgi:hypothetical protein
MAGGHLCPSVVDLFEPAHTGCHGMVAAISSRGTAFPAKRGLTMRIQTRTLAALINKTNQK